MDALDVPIQLRPNRVSSVLNLLPVFSMGIERYTVWEFQQSHGTPSWARSPVGRRAFLRVVCGGPLSATLCCLYATTSDWFYLLYSRSSDSKDKLLPLECGTDFSHLHKVEQRECR